MRGRFLKSAVHAADYPRELMSEVAMVGRSNSGKSSLINALLGAKIAKTSSTPGKTQLLNFFDVDGCWRLVDLPGYGFAARSGKQIRQWEKMIETYLSVRGDLKGVILVVDARRKPTVDEDVLREFLHANSRPLLLVLNKWDKLNQKEKNQAKKLWEPWCGDGDYLPLSARTKKGVENLKEFLLTQWV